MKVPEITEEIQQKYKYHTETSILGIQIIESLDDDYLIDVIIDEGGFGGKSKAIVDAMGGGYVNPSWIVSRAAETLYKRRVFDRVEFEYYSD